MDLRPPPKRSQHDRHDLDAVFKWLEDHYRIFDRYVSEDSHYSLTALDDRPRYRWKDANEIYIGIGSFLHNGTATQTVYWNSELTFAFGSGGSNGDSTDLAGDDWYYVYIDDSAVILAQTALLTASEFVAVTTEPTWSDTKKAFYNGNDRCIFAVQTDTGAVLEFHHTDDFVLRADDIRDLEPTDIDTTWTVATLTAPSFTTKIQIRATCYYVDGTSIGYLRTAGQVGNVGHSLGTVRSGAQYRHMDLPMITNADHQVEVKMSASNDNGIHIRTNGWYFPKGM